MEYDVILAGLLVWHGGKPFLAMRHGEELALKGDLLAGMPEGLFVVVAVKIIHDEDTGGIIHEVVAIRIVPDFLEPPPEYLERNTEGVIR
jgi:hypothetical protein